MNTEIAVLFTRTVKMALSPAAFKLLV